MFLMFLFSLSFSFWMTISIYIFVFKDQRPFKNANHLISTMDLRGDTTTRRTTTRGTTDEGNDDEGNDDAVSMLLYEENNILLENDEGERATSHWATFYQQRMVAFFYLLMININYLKLLKKF